MDILCFCLFIALTVVPATAQYNNTADNTNSTFTDTPIGKITVAPEPQVRGTYGIILSATTTFAFCVWRAVHPDIIPAVSSRCRVLYKSIWMFVAVILPEGIIVCAYGQWQEAREVYEEWIRVVNPNGIKGKDWKDPFGMKGAFFVVMGGFIIDEFEKPTLSQQSRFLPSFTDQRKTINTPYTSTLTPMGFKQFLASGHIDEGTFGPKFSPDDGSIIDHSIGTRSLDDKGNSSIPAKFIAAVQILWFLVQCISRGVHGLPLTLLEIHVAIQVLTTILTGCFWLNKPSEVREPILIPLRVLPENCILTEDKETQTPDIDKETQTLLVDKGAQTNDGIQTLPEPFPRDSHHRDERIKSCIEYKSEEINITQPHYTVITKSSPQHATAIASKALYDITKHIDGGREKKLVILVESILVCIIGALHAAAWNSYFPSFPENVMWKVSSLGICLFPLALACIALQTGYQEVLVKLIWDAQFLDPGLYKLLVYLCERLAKVWVEGVKKRVGEMTLEIDGEVERQVVEQRGGEQGPEQVPKVTMAIHKAWMGFLRFLLIGVCVLCFIGYGFCIFFITVESYISMRDPPQGTFMVAKWNLYWPHV